MTFKIIPAHFLIVARPVGRLTHDDMFDYFTNVRAHPEWARGMNRMVDNRRMTDIDLTYPEMRNLRAHELPPTPEQQSLPRTIFVCQNDTAYGMARMYKAIEQAPPHDQVSILDNFEDALNILQIPLDVLDEVLSA